MLPPFRDATKRSVWEGHLPGRPIAKVGFPEDLCEWDLGSPPQAKPFEEASRDAPASPLGSRSRLSTRCPSGGRSRLPRTVEVRWRRSSLNRRSEGSPTLGTPRFPSMSSSRFISSTSPRGTPSGSSTADLGIELLDLRLKRINYVEEVQQDVFARMIAERQRVAEQFRSEGQGESARINGERERELAQIQSEAYRQAEELRGQADAEATRVYEEAYNSDADFYAFTKSLETYEQTMDQTTLFILGTDSELLRFLEQPQ